MPRAVVSLLFNSSITLWLAGGYLLSLYWIELIVLSGIRELDTVSKLKPFIIGLVVFLALIVIPLGAWNNIELVDTVYNVVLAVICLALIVFFIVASAKLERIMRRSAILSNFSHFLHKLTKFIWLVTCGLLTLVITLLLFSILDGSHRTNVFLATEFVLRIGEFVSVLCTQLFIRKDRPRGALSTSSTGEINMTAEEKNQGSVNLP